MTTESEDGPRVVLRQAQYGKAEVRLLDVDRRGERHGITDLNVSVTLAGGLPETYLPAEDRILATAVRGHWRIASTAADWDACFARARAALVEAFAATYSRSLQQSLYAMGGAVLAARPEICEVRLSLPTKHHFLVDLGPFGLDNPGEVFYAADRPYGLIEGTVLRAGAAPGDPGHQW